VLRDDTTTASTKKIDEILDALPNKKHREIPIKDLQALIKLTMPDDRVSELVWNPEAVSESLAQFAKLHKQTTGYVFVDRERDLKESRRETQGILSGGETATVPNDKITLFLLRKGNRPEPRSVVATD
jgi:hypothetical protein